MSLTEALGGVAGYTAELGRQQAAQKHLAAARALIEQVLPPVGYRLRSSGSGQSLPKVAWVAILDPDVTTTAQRGLYVVYLFDVGTQHVFLSMNQGATAHLDYYRSNPPTPPGVERAALTEIRNETEAVRELLDPQLLSGTAHEIHLGSSLYLPRGYEAGNIAAITYDLLALPSEGQLREDLLRFLTMYQECVAARQAAVAADPVSFHVPAAAGKDPGGSVFKPKDTGDYLAWVRTHQQHRTRKHEALLNSFAAHAQSKGWTAGTKGVHPRDLVLDRDEVHLLIEAKTVRANSEFAVREAVGQLLAYEYVFYSTHAANKVALFSSPVGPLWVKFLKHHKIDCVWLDGAEWKSAGDIMAWVT